MLASFREEFSAGLTVVLGFEVSETGESLVLAGENKRKGFVFPSIPSQAWLQPSIHDICLHFVTRNHLDRVDLKRQD